MKRLLASLGAVLALALAGIASLSPPSPAALFASHYPAATCAPQALPISRVQSGITPGTDATSATTVTATLGATVASGDAVAGLVSWDTGASAAISSISDDKGNAYTVVDTLNDAVHAQSAATFYATNLTNGPKVITVTFNIAAAFRIVLVDELVNVTPASPLDGHTVALNATTPATPDGASSGTITTHNAKDAVWGGIMVENSNTITAGTGFVLGTNGGTGPAIASEMLVQTVAGTQAATFTIGFTAQTTTFALGLIAKQSCGGAPPPPPTVLVTAAFNAGDASIETAAEAFEATLGKPLAFVLQFGGAASESDFTGSTGFEFSLSPPSRKLLYSQPLIWSGATLAAAAAGTYDADYQSVANSIGTAYAAGQVYAVRIGWEENGTWYPWNIHTGAPADYVTAWRDLALKIKAAAPGIKLDWNQNIQQMDPSAAYPGDDVVDIMSIDAYENTAFASGTCAARWATFVGQPAGLVSLTTFQQFATAHNKPMAVSEYASNFNDGCFIQNIHDWITARNFVWHDYWNSTSAFNGLLSNYPINLSTFLNLWGTPSTGQVIAAGKQYWGVNGHNDTGSDGYGTSTNATKAADMKAAMGTTPNSIPYRGVPAGYGNYATDVNAMIAANIIPQVMVGAFPNFSGYANATAAYNGGYADMQSAINTAPAARLFEIGNEWTIFNGGVSPAYDTFANDGSHAADWRGQQWYSRMLGYTAGAVAAMRDLCATCQVVGGAYAGWVPFGLPVAMGVDLQTYVPPGGSTRDLRWDFTVVHWYQDTSCGGNNMGTDLSNFNGGMNLYTGLKPIGKPIMLTEFGSVACSASDATAAGFVTALMNNFLAHKATTATETGVAGGNFYQLYNADTGSWLLTAPGGSLTSEGTAYLNFLIAHGNPS